VIARGRKRVAKEQVAQARSAALSEKAGALASAVGGGVECSFCGQQVKASRGRDHRVSCPRYRR
jgi:hypothetical protein